VPGQRRRLGAGLSILDEEFRCHSEGSPDGGNRPEEFTTRRHFEDS
jgi:hypothetical protein